MPRLIKDRFNQVMAHPDHSKLTPSTRSLLWLYSRVWDDKMQQARRDRDGTITRAWKTLFTDAPPEERVALIDDPL